MHAKALVAALLVSASSIGLAAPPVYLTVNHSAEAVMDKTTASAVWKEQLPTKVMLRLAQLYPVARYGFISQVEGGFSDAKQCVITARVMLVPRAGKRLVFEAKKSATTFDAQPNLTQPQCKDLAKAKLNEAITAVLGSLIAS